MLSRAVQNPEQYSMRVQHPISTLGPDLYRLKYAIPIMAEVDALPKEWREFVHEFGLVVCRRARKQFRSAAKARLDRLGAELSETLDL